VLEVMLDGFELCVAVVPELPRRLSCPELGQHATVTLDSGSTSKATSSNSALADTVAIGTGAATGISAHTAISWLWANSLLTL